jgi:hypothetical protein
MFGRPLEADHQHHLLLSISSAACVSQALFEKRLVSCSFGAIVYYIILLIEVFEYTPLDPDPFQTNSSPFNIFLVMSHSISDDKYIHRIFKILCSSFNFLPSCCQNRLRAPIISFERSSHALECCQVEMISAPLVGDECWSSL